MQKYNKTFFEHYARLMLIETYDPAYRGLSVSDKPDLQSAELDCGIEVTQAISETEGRCNFDVINRFKERGFGYEDIRFEVIRRASEQTDRPVNIPRENRLFDPDVTFNLVQERIVDKLEKLNRNYRIYTMNGLYLFAETPLLSEFDIRLITTFIELAEEDYRITFDLYFVDCIDLLYVYHSQKRTLRVIEIPTNRLKWFKEEAARNSEQAPQTE